MTKKVPVKYSRALWNRIIGELKRGRTLKEVCRDPGMPHFSTAWDWVNADKDGIAAGYQEARRLGYIAMGDDLLAIADDDSDDRVVGPNGSIQFDHANVHRARLMIDTRKWLLAKALPKMYGEKIEHTHEAGDSIQGLLTTIDGATRGIPARLEHRKIIDLEEEDANR